VTTNIVTKSAPSVPIEEKDGKPDVIPAPVDTEKVCDSANEGEFVNNQGNEIWEEFKETDEGWKEVGPTRNRVTKPAPRAKAIPEGDKGYNKRRRHRSDKSKNNPDAPHSSQRRDRRHHRGHRNTKLATPITRSVLPEQTGPVAEAVTSPEELQSHPLDDSCMSPHRTTNMPPVASPVAGEVAVSGSLKGWTKASPQIPSSDSSTSDETSTVGTRTPLEIVAEVEVKIPEKNVHVRGDMSPVSPLQTNLALKSPERNASKSSTGGVAPAKEAAKGGERGAKLVSNLNKCALSTAAVEFVPGKVWKTLADIEEFVPGKPWKQLPNVQRSQEHLRVYFIVESSGNIAVSIVDSSSEGFGSVLQIAEEASDHLDKKINGKHVNSWNAVVGSYVPKTSPDSLLKHSLLMKSDASVSKSPFPVKDPIKVAGKKKLIQLTKGMKTSDPVSSTPVPTSMSTDKSPVESGDEDGFTLVTHKKTRQADIVTKQAGKNHFREKKRENRSHANVTVSVS